MSFNFDELLQQGKGAAENVMKNRSEIRSVLTDLENSLSKFLGMSIKLEEHTEYVQGDQNPITMFANSFKPKEKTGFNLVSIKSTEVDISKELFKLKYSDDVYPITIVRERSHLVADDQSEFASSIGQIASSSQFHLQLNSFKRQVDAKLKEKPLSVPRAE